MTPRCFMILFLTLPTLIVSSTIVGNITFTGMSELSERVIRQIRPFFKNTLELRVFDLLTGIATPATTLSDFFAVLDLEHQYLLHYMGKGVFDSCHLLPLLQFQGMLDPRSGKPLVLEKVYVHYPCLAQMRSFLDWESIKELRLYAAHSVPWFRMNQLESLELKILHEDNFDYLDVLSIPPIRKLAISGNHKKYMNMTRLVNHVCRNGLKSFQLNWISPRVVAVDLMADLARKCKLEEMVIKSKYAGQVLRRYARSLRDNGQPVNLRSVELEFWPNDSIDLDMKYLERFDKLSSLSIKGTDDLEFIYQALIHAGLFHAWKPMSKQSNLITRLELPDIGLSTFLQHLCPSNLIQYLWVNDIPENLSCSALRMLKHLKLNQFSIFMHHECIDTLPALETLEIRETPLIYLSKVNNLNIKKIIVEKGSWFTADDIINVVNSFPKLELLQIDRFEVMRPAELKRLRKIYPNSIMNNGFNLKAMIYP